MHSLKAEEVRARALAAQPLRAPRYVLEVQLVILDYLIIRYLILNLNLINFQSNA